METTLRSRRRSNQTTSIRRRRKLLLRSTTRLHRRIRISSPSLWRTKLRSYSRRANKKRSKIHRLLSFFKRNITQRTQTIKIRTWCLHTRSTKNCRTKRFNSKTLEIQSRSNLLPRIHSSEKLLNLFHTNWRTNEI